MFYVTDYIGGATPVGILKLIRLDTNIWVTDYEGKSIILMDIKR